VISAGEAWYDIASNGTLVYLPGPMGSGVPDRKLGWFDRAGAGTLLPVSPGPYETPRVSPNGKRIAFGRADGRDSSIWVYDLGAGASPRRLTFGGRDRLPVWSADSQWVIFQSDRGGDSGLYRQQADGSGSAERLPTTPSGAVHAPWSASPDGSVLLYVEQAARQSRLLIYSFKDRTSVLFGSVAAAGPIAAAFSPDGKWVAYSIRESNETTIMPYVQPYPATGAKYQMTSNREGGHTPVWSPDGRELFYSPGPTPMLASVKVTTSPTFAFGPGEPVRRGFISLPPGAGRTYDAAGPGLRFLGIPIGNIDPQSPSGRDELRVVTNWVTEIKARVK